MILSVVMAVYNPDLNELKLCLSSLLNQTFNDFELVLVNDGGEKTIFEGIEEVGRFKKCKIINLEKNNGLAAALNVAVSESSGVYIARMDADDICARTRFEVQLSFLRHNKDVDIIGSWAKCIGSSKKIIRTRLKHNEIFMQSFFNSPMVHPSVMGKRSIFELRYDESLRKAQDYELWCRALNSGFRFANINKVLLLYRVRCGSNSSAAQIYTAEKIRANHIRKIDFLGEAEKKTLLKLANRFIVRKELSLFDLMKVCASVFGGLGWPLFALRLFFINYLKYLVKRP